MLLLKRCVFINKLLCLLFCSLFMACEDDASTAVVIAPAIEDSRVLEAAPSSNLVLHGSDLDHTAEVRLHEQQLTISSASAEQLSIEIPATAASGMLHIRFKNSDITISRFLKVTDKAFSKQDFNFNTFGQIQFLSDQTAVVYANGSIFKSGDGGNSWSEIYNSIFISPEHPFSVLDENHIWVARNEEKDLAISRDGGSTWSEVDALPTAFDIQEIYLLSPEKVILAAKNVLDGKGYIFVSENGGSDWIQVHKSDRTSLYKAQVCYGGSHAVYMLDSESNLLLKSTDGGASWTESVLDIHLPTAGAALSFIDATTAWAYNGARIGGSTPGVYKTTDAGESWQLLFEPVLSSFDETLVAVHFQNEQEGVIVTSKGGYMVTEDGGMHWKLYYLAEPSLEFIGFGMGNVYFYNGSLIKKSF